MQTFVQTTAGVQTIQLNVTGKYFTILATNLGLNVRFYVGGKKKDLGDIKGLLAGLEVLFDGADNFDRVEIDTLGGDTIMVGIGNGQARYNRSQGNVAITNIPHVIVDLIPKTIIDGQTFNGSYASNTALAANTPDTIFTPAANVNGAIIKSGNIYSFGIAQTQWSIIAKNAAPVSTIDTTVILRANSNCFIAGTHSMSGSFQNAIKIPAGLGLYFIPLAAEIAAGRNVLFELL